jgi:hypothetical protein
MKELLANNLRAGITHQRLALKFFGDNMYKRQNIAFKMTIPNLFSFFQSHVWLRNNIDSKIARFFLNLNSADAYLDGQITAPLAAVLRNSVGPKNRHPHHKVDRHTPTFGVGLRKCRKTPIK